jgi:ATP-binding cassette subfamily B protein
VLPLFALPARRVGRVLRDLRRQSMENNAEMNAVMSETLNVAGALLVKLFGREDYEMGRFSKEADSVRDIGVRSAVVGRWFFFMLGVVSAVGTAVIYWVGGYLVFRDAFSIGTIVAFGSYLRQLYGPLMSISNIPVEFAQSMVSFERVFEVLDIPVEIEENPSAVVLPPVKGSIRFDHVSFSYQDAAGPIGLAEIVRFGQGRRGRGGGDTSALVRRGRERSDEDGDDGAAAPSTAFTRRWALNDVSFTLEPGELTALVGPSGSGKTTITYLIPRLYDPTLGRVCLDGHDLRDVTLDSLSANIGMVTQDSYLFYDTIRANLIYARRDAGEAEMMEAARAANIHDFIMTLPDGYDTVVGERGYRLSGGERQRISIARVILKDPRVLVLDEATSHLDSLSEALIQEALQRVMHGRTSLVIAHRLATILAADKILVLNEGQLVETGNHETLLARGGLYTRLYETQFRDASVET